MKKFTLLSLLALFFTASCSEEHISAKRESLAPWQQEEVEQEVLSPEENRETLDNTPREEGGALEPDGMEPTGGVGL